MSPEHPRTSPDVFDHRRREDGEHVGYIEMRPDGGFVPYDLLWTPHGEDLELDEAEAILDEIGLRLLAQDWLLADELSGRVAKAVTRAETVELELPTTRLRPAR